jgi:hypothetical protein
MWRVYGTSRNDVRDQWNIAGRSVLLCSAALIDSDVEGLHHGSLSLLCYLQAFTLKLLPCAWQCTPGCLLRWSR